MLVDDYPEVVKQIREMREICEAEQPEFDLLSKETDRLLLNMFITTCDEYGIERFEKEFGVVPMPGQRLEERRIAVLVRKAKKSLRFKDVLNLIQNYSHEINLVPDYQKDELNVIVGDMENNVRAIYKTLDEVSGLNIYIYFTCIAESFLRMPEASKAVEMETIIRGWLGQEKQLVETECETHTETIELFRETEVIMQKDLWRLDGTVKLDGSRKMDAEERKEKA